MKYIPSLTLKISNFLALHFNFNCRNCFPFSFPFPAEKEENTVRASSTMKWREKVDVNVKGKRFVRESEWMTVHQLSNFIFPFRFSPF